MQMSIVVVNYNTRDLLRQCLSSVFANPPRGRQFQVIVGDNASCDGSADMKQTGFLFDHADRSLSGCRFRVDRSLVGSPEGRGHGLANATIA